MLTVKQESVDDLGNKLAHCENELERESGRANDAESRLDEVLKGAAANMETGNTADKQELLNKINSLEEKLADAHEVSRGHRIAIGRIFANVSESQKRYLRNWQIGFRNLLSVF